MRKKRLTLLDKERAKTKDLEIGQATLRNQLKARDEELRIAKSEKTNLEYRIKPIRVRQFAIADLTNGNFEKWQRLNPGYSIIKWHFVEIAGYGNFSNQACLVFFKE